MRVQGHLPVHGARARATPLKRREAEIRYPRSRLDKLGVRPGQRVSVLGVEDSSFWKEIDGRGADVSRRVRKGSDLIIVTMRAVGDLDRLRALRQSILDNGAIWVVWPKGRKEFREDDIRAFGPRAELVDVKVVAFAETLSALKMVVPLALRRKR